MAKVRKGQLWHNRRSSGLILITGRRNDGFKRWLVIEYWPTGCVFVDQPYDEYEFDQEDLVLLSDCTEDVA